MYLYVSLSLSIYIYIYIWCPQAAARPAPHLRPGEDDVPAGANRANDRT